MLPEHIAIIMDGNGRWAKRRGYPRIIGHREGARNVKRIATIASNRGIKILTIYGFSVENWSRPEREVSMLFRLMKVYTHVGRKLCKQNNIKFDLIGRIHELPDFLKDALLGLKEFTKSNTGMVLQCAINYGSRDEIIRAVQSIAGEIQLGSLKADQITEHYFHQKLDTRGQKDPDLVIRTSGELRISNYLLWQSAYAEYYFDEAYWPDFDESAFDRALQSYASRERRFGKTGEQVVR